MWSRHGQTTARGPNPARRHLRKLNLPRESSGRPFSYLEITLAVIFKKISHDGAKLEWETRWKPFFGDHICMRMVISKKELYLVFQSACGPWLQHCFKCSPSSEKFAQPWSGVWMLGQTPKTWMALHPVMSWCLRYWVSRNRKLYCFADRTIDKNCMTNRGN